MNPFFMYRRRKLRPLFPACTGLLAILLLLNLQSCRKLVSDDFPEFPAFPVINGILVADSTLMVHVSLTDKIGKERLAVTENALVIVKSNNNFTDTLEYTGEGFYSSNLPVVPLQRYTCEALMPGYSAASGSVSIPAAPEILYIEHINNAGRDVEGIAYPALKIKFKNNPGEKLYFEVLLKLFEYESIRLAEVTPITDPVLLNEGLPIVVFSNETLTGDSYTLTLNYTTGSYEGRDGVWYMDLYPMVVELRSVSSDYYHYLRQLYLYETGRYPENVGTSAVTNFNLYSNIENGFGIFTGYSATVSDTLHPENN